MKRPNKQDFIKKYPPNLIIEGLYDDTIEYLQELEKYCDFLESKKGIKNNKEKEVKYSKKTSSIEVVFCGNLKDYEVLITKGGDKANANSGIVHKSHIWIHNNTIEKNCTELFGLKNGGTVFYRYYEGRQFVTNEEIVSVLGNIL